jgi:hypothetical protein
MIEIWFWTELWVWLGTMYITSLAYFALARRYHAINPYKAAVPMANAKFMSRLALTNALNYFAFAAIGSWSMFEFIRFLPDVRAILGQWFIVEIFIFWNLRTAALIFIGMRNTKVEI